MPTDLGLCKRLLDRRELQVKKALKALIETVCEDLRDGSEGKGHQVGFNLPWSQMVEGQLCVSLIPHIRLDACKSAHMQ